MALFLTPGVTSVGVVQMGSVHKMEHVQKAAGTDITARNVWISAPHNVQHASRALGNNVPNVRRDTMTPKVIELALEGVKAHAKHAHVVRTLRPGILYVIPVKTGIITFAIQGLVT